MSNKFNSNVDYTQKVLEVKNLKKYFYMGVGKGKLTVPAVDNVSFDVYKREVFGLVGESGCGKTTTGRTIIKLYNPTDGSVDLNGIRIGAGYGGKIQNIKRIKKEAKEKLLELNPDKIRAYRINEEAKAKIEILKQDIQILGLKLKDNIKEAQKPMEDYASDAYQLKSLYQLDIAKINYDFILHKHEINQQTDNQMQTEYKNEVAIAITTYNHKLDGLKDSAALKKEVIEQHIHDLKAEHIKNLENLKKHYEPLIVDADKHKLQKSDAKLMIQKINQERKQKILDRQAQFKADNQSLIIPNKLEVQEKVKSLNIKHKLDVEAKNKEIKAINAEAKKQIAALPKLEMSSGDRESLKSKIEAIKAERSEKIRFEKDEIRNIKTVNKSKEALVASRKMQMIFQDPISSLNPRMTVKEIVGEGLTILGGYTDEEITQKVSDVLVLVGLSADYAARYPHEFSGGQRQRIGIARALIMNPNFIIADEPISSLDVSIRAQVINLLTDLREELGLTILFIAHDLSVVRFFCDRIAVMYYGKLVEMAPSEDLFAHPMHPYTRSLLSAIPQPDPDYEKGRKRINYDPAMHNYRTDKPSLREIRPGHFVLVNEQEYTAMKKEVEELVNVNPKEVQ